MKVLVCLSQPEEAKLIFEYTTSVIKNLKVSCQVYCSLNHEHVRNKLSENIHSYDILILDALDKECLALAQYLRSRNLVSTIIFIARKPFKLHNILIYRPSFIITKMDDVKQIHSALVLAYNEQINARPYFTVKNKDEFIRINHADILWFESRQRVVILHSKNQKIYFYGKLSDIHQLLPKEHFVRCHQSFIVNYHMIQRVDRVNRCLYLITGDVIEISKSYYSQVMSYIDDRGF